MQFYFRRGGMRAAIASESHNHTGADAEVVLVVVAAVVDSGYEIIGFDEADGEAATGFEVEASAEVGCEGCAGVCCAWICAFNQGSGRMHRAHQYLSERLHACVMDGGKITHACGEGAQRERVCTGTDAACMVDGDVASQGEVTWLYRPRKRGADSIHIEAG